jgi:hypothetical protein
MLTAGDPRASTSDAVVSAVLWYVRTTTSDAGDVHISYICAHADLHSRNGTKIGSLWPQNTSAYYDLRH